MSEPSTPIAGRNGVVIVKSTERSADQSSGYRTYEVHQRERVGESTPLIKPGVLISDEFRRDPYPLCQILRENYPCYRNWQTNSYWLTRYDDVTSVFVDDANFESRPRRWLYNQVDLGRDLGDKLPVLTAEAKLTDALAQPIAKALAERLAAQSTADLVSQFTAKFPLELLAALLALPEVSKNTFYNAYWRAQRGTSWMPSLQRDGALALQELVRFFRPLVFERQQNPAEDLLSALVTLSELDGGAEVTAEDVVVTLLERDHETLQGSLTNLWFLLLTDQDAFDQARAERRLMKLAYLETVRHSTPVLAAHRYTRHEVERFGKLLPAGALVVCSAAAANRDPRIFSEPDRFIVDRKDLCQREPRGQYRADGLASGITFGLGKPSIYPAVPEDRPRSKYALNRDTVVTVSTILAEVLPDLRLAADAHPYLTALSVGEMHTCWQLPVVC